MSIRTSWVGLCLLVVLAAWPSMAVAQQGLAGPLEGESLAEWTQRWMDGPAGVLATEDEQAMYQSLSSTQERLEFIRLFWERRDPRPLGDQNEYLDQIAERLDYIEANFADEDKPGWETVFGRVVLLYGVPDRTRRELGLPRGFSDRPPILWSYDERIPGLEPNEDLLFAYRAGTWKLMPPYPMDSDPIAESMRDAERQSVLPLIPNDYRRSMEMVQAATLRNDVDYDSVRDAVTTRVQLPVAQIPFSWSATSAAAETGKQAVTLQLNWRLDSLVFHLQDGSYTTDMRLDVRLLAGDEPAAMQSERVVITVPESEMDSRRQEVVTREMMLEVPPGDYAIELVLLDRLLGYRTVYTGTVSAR